MPWNRIKIAIISSDRSSYSDDGLLYTVQLFEFSLTPLHYALSNEN